MTSYLRKTFLVLATIAAAASTAFAIQTLVMIQGFLTNSSGTPYTTAQSTEFRVYQGGNATTAGTGTLYYDETATITPSASGVFNYPLGSGTPTVPFLIVGGGPIPNRLSTTTFDTSSAVYLEISVAGTVVLPRLQMLGTPYAALAGASESLKPTTLPLITTSNLQASSGTFTASGPTQYSLATASGIIVVAGGVTAPYFNGMLIGNIKGNAANVTGTVAVANGGTGAATAAEAQTNLGVPSTTGSGASGTWGISITGSAGSATGTPPIGSIVLYAGETEPPGWIETDGRSLSQSGTYSASWGNFNTSAIFAAIGTAWGSSGAGVFNIPDFRGTFPRGWNHGKTGSYSDPDASARTNQYTSGTTGDNVGSYQADSFKSHTHNYGSFNGCTGQSSCGSFLLTSSLTNPTSATGGDETRPLNGSVMYIIRVQ